MSGQLFSRGSIFLVCLAILLHASGCNRGPRRISVHGRVTLDGQPIDLGTITFVPDPTGPRVSASINAGLYHIESSRGPLAGGKIVVIRVPRLEGSLTRKEKLVQMVDAPEALPARYNAKSELRATVAEYGPNEFNFDLTSDAK